MNIFHHIPILERYPAKFEGEIILLVRGGVPVVLGNIAPVITTDSMEPDNMWNGSGVAMDLNPMLNAI